MFSLKITMGNAEMYTMGDVSVALRALADKLVRGSEAPATGSIRDINGNTVGTWKYIPPKG